LFGVILQNKTFLMNFDEHFDLDYSTNAFFSYCRIYADIVNVFLLCILIAFVTQCCQF